MNMMILRVRLVRSNIEEALQVFEAIRGPVSVQPGCRHIELWIDAARDNELVLFEQWDSFEHLERHIRSTDFRGILAIMDMAMEPPAMRFYNICDSDDFDLVVRLRDHSQDVVEGQIEKRRPFSIR
jgi:quinol monooxygenase YgiN